MKVGPHLLLGLLHSWTLEGRHYLHAPRKRRCGGNGVGPPQLTTQPCVPSIILSSNLHASLINTSEHWNPSLCMLARPQRPSPAPAAPPST